MHGFIQRFNWLQFGTRLDKHLSSLSVNERNAVVLEENLESCIIVSFINEKLNSTSTLESKITVLFMNVVACVSPT